METTDTPDTLTPVRDALARRYAIERELGRGGMATVYLARDLKHGRAVAVKVLHPELSAALGAERFLKEIELTASLQHPHILPLFDSGSAGGLLYYVMPFVAGETLRARLQRERQLPVGEAVLVAREVADALAYAHARGVIHRDVKPENILLQDGHALVADFGIALAVQQAGGARMTQTGLSLGTPQYMAPEQAGGERAIDARADVYALGAVLYEMLAGEAPFTGPTLQAIVSRILTEAPRPLPTARPTVPASLAAVVETAMAKLAADRFASAAELREALARSTRASVVRAAASGTRRRPWPLAAGAVATLVAGGALGWALAARGGAGDVAPRPPVRFVIEPDSGLLLRTAPAISPDGRTIVFGVQAPDGTTQLHARAIDSVESRVLPETDDADVPTFSPDGEWIAFARGGVLRRVRLDGTQVDDLARLPGLTPYFNLTWISADTILVATHTPLLAAASIADRRVAPVTQFDDTVALFSVAPLPDGRLLAVSQPATPRGVSDRVFGIYDRASKRFTPLGTGSGARYANGAVIFCNRAGELFTQPLDLAAGRLLGTPRQVGANVQFGREMPAFAVSATGTIVYRIGFPTTPVSGRMRLLDRRGAELRAFSTRAAWTPRVSPDGRRLAHGGSGPGEELSDIWISEVDGQLSQRLTSDGRDANDATWSPDGRSLAISMLDSATWKGVALIPASGGPARKFPLAPWFTAPGDWTRDARTLLITRIDTTGTTAVWAQPVEGGAPRRLFATTGNQSGPRVSPDGRWVAYTSDETGRREVYVQRWPSLDGKLRVSARGGVHPVWAREGRALFYWQDDQLVEARLGEGPSGGLAVEGVEPLFRTPYLEGLLQNYDVLPGGRAFVVVTARARTNRIAVVMDAPGEGR